MLVTFRSGFPNGHFSLRQLETYIACPHQYWLAYVRKMKWPKTPAGAAFGSAMHRAIEKINRIIFLKQMLDEELAFKLFADEWELELEYNQPIEYKNNDDPESLLEKGKELVELYLEHFGDIKPKAVEQEFELPIPGRRWFKPRTIKGRLDLIVDGELLEFKTSSKSASQNDVDVPLQLMLYSWAYRQLYGHEEEVLKTVVLIKTKTPKIQIIDSHCTTDDHEMLMEMIDQVIKSIRHKIFFKNPNTRYGCSFCTYCDVCRREGDDATSRG